MPGPVERMSGDATLAAIERFNAAFNRQDIDATMAAMTDDPIFENTNPPPDGQRSVGADAVRQAFSECFASSPGAQFEVEEQFAARSEERRVGKECRSRREPDQSRKASGEAYAGVLRSPSLETVMMDTI